MILRLRVPDRLVMSSMHRVYRIFGKAALAGIFILSSGCSDTTGQSIEPSDLIGTWTGSPLEGVTNLTFKVVTGIPIYELRDPTGGIADKLGSSNDLLVQGKWSLSGRVLSLFDDEAGPLVCASLEDDRFEVSINDERTFMFLDHLGEECGARASYLATNYQRRPDDEP